MNNIQRFFKRYVHSSVKLFCFFILINIVLFIVPVSYTHLDVYKRQGPDKGKLLFPGQFAGQGRLNLAGKLAVPGFLDLLHTVPEGGAVCKLWRGVGGQHDFRMDDAALPGVIMGQAVPFICQFGSASVGSCGNSGTALAALDDRCV